MRENKFQSTLKKELKERFPGCLIIKNDPNDKAGIPDLTIFYRNMWAMLEVKRSMDAPRQPLQEYYIDWANSQSFGRFICPENKEEVLNELERSFGSHR